jgi:hypothetical protein
MDLARLYPKDFDDGELRELRHLLFVSSIKEWCTQGNIFAILLFTDY